MLKTSHLVGYERASDAGNSAGNGDDGEHVLDIDDVLVVDGERNEHGEDGAEHDQEELGQDGEQLGDERAEIEHGGLVSTRQACV